MINIQSSLSYAVGASLALAISVLFEPSPAQAQTEFQSYVEPVDACFDDLETAYEDLPEVIASDDQVLLRAFNDRQEPMTCTLQALMAESELSDAGYFSIIEYRDNWSNRKARYAEIISISENWEVRLRNERPQVLAAQEEAQETAYRKELRERHTIGEPTSHYRTRRFCILFYSRDSAELTWCMEDNGHSLEEE